MVQPNEMDFRVSILDSFLISTHRELAEVAGLHQALLERDPLFYGHLAVWAQKNLEVRDHKELFVSGLFASARPDHREAAWVLLQGFPPYEVNRLVTQVKEQYRKNVPRIMKQAVESYVRTIESNAARFDGAITRQREAMLSLYARLRLKPSAKAQKALFDREPETGSQAWVVRELARLKDDPAAQAELIAKHDIPFPIAVSALKQITPSVLVALIGSMTPQEVLQSMGMLKRRGAFDHAEVKALVEAKLEDAKQAPVRVDALKARKAAEAVPIPADLREKLVEVTEQQLKKYRIRRSTALLVDASGSMSDAIEIAKQLGALISARIEGAALSAFAFDTVPYEVTCASTKLADWDKAFAGIKGGGGTSCGIALQLLARQTRRVEQVVMITDEGENTAPFFKDAYAHYSDRVGMRPHVVFVKLGGSSEQLEIDCRAAKIPFDAVTVPQNKLDYYSMPAILALLARGSRGDLVLEILETPLPKRK